MASSEPFIGEIALFGTFVPDGWLPCDGRLVSHNSYPALFALIGYNFGGSGAQFALPDLRDVIPVGTGSGPGLTPVQLGTKFGANEVTLTPQQTPHSHRLQRKGATSVAQKTNSIGPNTNLAQVARQYDVPGNQWELVPHFLANTNPNSSLAPQSIAMTGSGVAHENRQPFVALNFGIAIDGHYPPRP